MCGKIQSALLEIVSHGNEHQPAEFQLSRLIVGIIEKTVVDLEPTLLDLREQWDQSGLQLCEQRCHAATVDPGSYESRERIVGEPSENQKLCFLTFQRQDCSQAGQEQSEIVLRFGFGPYLLRQRALATQLHDKIGRQFFGTAVVSPHFAQQGAGRFVPQLAILFSGETGVQVEPAAEQPFRLGETSFWWAMP